MKRPDDTRALVWDRVSDLLSEAADLASDMADGIRAGDGSARLRAIGNRIYEKLTEADRAITLVKKKP